MYVRGVSNRKWGCQRHDYVFVGQRAQEQFIQSEGVYRLRYCQARLFLHVGRQAGVHVKLLEAYRLYMYRYAYIYKKCI